MEAIWDLVVGNVPGARNPDDSDMTAMVGAVTTRAQARQEVRHKPLTIPATPKHTGVDRGELIRLQQDNETIKRMGETAMSEIVREEHHSSRYETEFCTKSLMARLDERLTYDKSFSQKA